MGWTNFGCSDDEASSGALDDEASIDASDQDVVSSDEPSSDHESSDHSYDGHAGKKKAGGSTNEDDDEEEVTLDARETAQFLNNEMMRRCKDIIMVKKKIEECLTDDGLLQKMVEGNLSILQCVASRH